MKEAIFIGRFQPFHKGHLEVVQQISAMPEIGGIRIGIGSSNKSNTTENPFTLEERRDMIALSAPAEKMISIDSIPDVGDNKLWTEAVLAQYKNEAVFFSGNPLLLKLFSEAGREVRTVPPHSDISGTKVRERMIRGLDWQSLVPFGTKKILDSIDAISRLREIYCTYMRPGLTVDILVDYQNEGLVCIERLNEPYQGWLSLPGGYLNFGREDAPTAASRELFEETNLTVAPDELSILDVYSDPNRDPRGHIISVAYHTAVSGGELKAKDDAKSVMVVPFEELGSRKFGFDHGKIVADFLRKTQKGGLK